MADEPILNKILDDLKSAVAGVSAAGNYAQTLAAEYRELPYNVAESLKAVVRLDGDPEILPRSTSGESGFVEWRQPVKVIALVVPPEVTDAPPPDRLIIQVWSDIVKAVMLDRRRGDLADTELVAPTFFDDGVEARFVITYETRVDDPTRQT